MISLIKTITIIVQSLYKCTHCHHTPLHAPVIQLCGVVLKRRYKLFLKLFLQYYIVSQ